jgi:hypothetical protein
MEEDIASIFNKKHGYDFCNYVDYFSKLIVDIGNVRKWKTAKNNMTVPGGTKYVQHILGWIEGYVGTPVKMGILYLFFEDKGVSKELLGLKIGTF